MDPEELERLVQHYETRISTLKELELTQLQKKWERELKLIKIEHRYVDKNLLS